MSKLEIHPLECVVFFSFLRIRCRFNAGEDKPLSVQLLHDGHEPSLDRQDVQIVAPQAGEPAEFILEAMIRRADFPDSYSLRVGFRTHSSSVSCREIVDYEKRLYAHSIMPTFRDEITKWLAAHPGRRPQLLDVGGRARSGYRHAKEFGECDVLTIDIVADPSVDVVADIHGMSGKLGTDRFDFAICISVFEHLLMPWKAVIEINKVLRVGACLLIQTHQTAGMHDLPWDYYRYSDGSWKGLFNQHTGFEIRQTALSSFQRIVPMHNYAAYEGFESAGGFNDSSVVAVKTGPTNLRWPVDLSDLVDDHYPG